MSQKPRASRFETPPSARLRLAIRGKAYTAAKLGRLLLLYAATKAPACGSSAIAATARTGPGRSPWRTTATRDILGYCQAIDECKRAADIGQHTDALAPATLPAVPEIHPFDSRRAQV